MGPLLGLVTAGVVLSVVYLFAHIAAQARGRAWRAAAKAAGLTSLVSSDFLGIETGLTGRSGLLRVALERYQRGRHEKGTRIVIDNLGHPSYEFALRKEGVGSAIEKAFGEREIEVGDPEFDRRAYIHGSPRVVHAVLDSGTRRLVGELIDGRIPTEGSGAPLEARVAVSDGALRAEIAEPAFQPGGERLTGALATLLDAARGLTLPDDIPARLADNVRTDSLPQVRLANLQTLVREYPTYTATREALRAGCDDRDDEVRLRAAIALGEEGHEVLRRIASGVDVSDGRSARAVAALKAHLTREEAEGILRSALESGRRATARAAVTALGRIGGAEVVTALTPALGDDDDELVVAAARALGATGSAAAEAPLVAVLDRDGPSVWPAIAEALGAVGTAAAVAPLRTMASRFPFDLGLRRASRQAIAEIQSRLTGATPGQLSLAAGGAGQLTLAEEGLEGRVSMTVEGEAPDSFAEDAADDETRWPTDAKDDASGERTRNGGDDSSSKTLPPRRETE
jgi:hypothetical protein